MYDHEELKQGVEAAARHWERECLERSPFHLSACGGCGAPSFQQPCPLCRYYPIWGDNSCSPKVATKQMFCEMVGRSGPAGRDGTIVTWLIKNNDRRFPDQADSLARALDVDVPPAAAYWDAVAEGADFSREFAGHAVHAGWRGMFELRAVVSGGYGGGGNPRLLPAVEATAAAWVNAVHADDTDGMLEAASAGRRLAIEAKPSSNAPGNLRAAAEHFDRVAELLAVQSLAP